MSFNANRAVQDVAALSIGQFGVIDGYQVHVAYPLRGGWVSVVDPCVMLLREVPGKQPITIFLTEPESRGLAALLSGAGDLARKSKVLTVDEVHRFFLDAQQNAIIDPR